MVSSTSNGDLVFHLRDLEARIVEVVCDFGPVVGVRILAMRTEPDGARSLRLPAGTACVRYCFRIDGDVIHDPDAPTSSSRQAWRTLPVAA